MTEDSTIVASPIAAPHSVGYAKKTKEFLIKNHPNEYNPKTLSKVLGIPYGSLRSELNRLLKSGQIARVHRGFYSAKINLNKHQIEKIDNKIDLHYHNIQFWIPKIGTNGMQQFSPTVPPIVATKISSDCSKNAAECSMIAADCSKNVTECSTIETIEINPNQSIKIIECPDHFDVIVGASQNPLGHREAKWMTELLKLRFGQAALQRAELVKYDINHDDVRTQWSPNQITYGNFERSVIAIYQKGEVTRFEGRNMHDHKTFKEFLYELIAREDVIELHQKQQKQGSEEVKTTESNQKQPDRQLIVASEFREEQVCGE